MMESPLLRSAARRCLRAASLILLLLLPVLVHAQTQKAPPLVPPAQIVAEIHRLINIKRSIRNLPALRLNDTLSTIIEGHSLRMAAGSVSIGHDGFDDRANQIEAAWNGSFPMAENVTEGTSAEEAVELWWRSESHKANLMGEWTDTGIAVAWDGAVWDCTQIFVQR